jgi:hypothetical protein
MIKTVITIASLVVALFMFLYGPGIWNRPDIKITGQSIDLRIPDKLQSDFFLFRMLFWAADIRKRILLNLEDNLRRQNFSEEKLRLLKPIVEEYLRNEQPLKVDAIARRLQLTASDERALVVAIFNMRNLAFTGSGFLPSNIFSFKVTNDGKKDAEDMQLTIKVSGRYMDNELQCNGMKCNGKKVKFDAEGDTIRITLEKLSPRGGDITGDIWYDSWPSTGTHKDTIVAVYKDGRKPAEFTSSGLDKSGFK